MRLLTIAISSLMLVGIEPSTIALAGSTAPVPPAVPQFDQRAYNDWAASKHLAPPQEQQLRSAVPPLPSRSPERSTDWGEATQTVTDADNVGKAAAYQAIDRMERANRELDEAQGAFKGATKALNRAAKIPAVTAEDLDAAKAAKRAAREGLKEARETARGLNEAAEQAAKYKHFGKFADRVAKGTTALDVGSKLLSDNPAERAQGEVEVYWEVGEWAVGKGLGRVHPGLQAAWELGTGIGDAIREHRLEALTPGDPKTVGDWLVDRAVKLTHPDPDEHDYRRFEEEARTRIRAQRAANEASAARRRDTEQAASSYASSYDEDGAGTAVFLNQLTDTLNQIAVEQQMRRTRNDVSPGSGSESGTAPSASPDYNASPTRPTCAASCSCGPRTPGSGVC